MRNLAFLLLLLLAAPLSAAAQERTAATLYKDPQCSCCSTYADYLRVHGFEVTVIETSDLWSVKQEYGVPDDLSSCHTMTVGGYVVEGHVPISAIERLLAEKPEIKGIALPGMPQGSPGMSGEKSAPFEIFIIKEGAPEIYEVK